MCGLFNQENEDNTCDHCDNDPCSCYETPPDLSVVRMLGILARMQGIGSVHYIAPTVPLALLAQGDLGETCGREFGEWLSTPQGKFATFYAERGSR